MKLVGFSAAGVYVRPPTFVPALVVCFAAAAVGARFTTPAVASDWYHQLKKPPWQPPAGLFAPLWTILYTLMAVSAAMLWSRPDTRKIRLSKVLFGSQLTLNAAWSYAFFGRRSPGTGLVVICALVTSIFTYAVKAWSESKAASVLFLPYDLWVSFAAVLNGWIFFANRPRRGAQDNGGR